MSRLSLDMTTVRIPTATYRLQFNKNFTFQQAREIVSYLHQLGISDAYASPYFQAGAESLHGYDITDHNKFNAAIGSREDYDAWVAELHAHGMGQIADFVPNHMGINDPQNVWWQDVLENGTSSLYAPYFDIDWRPLKMTRFAILRSTLPFFHVEICGAGVSPVDFKNGNREQLPYNLSAPPYRSHFFRHIDAEQFQATLQDAPGQIAQCQPR